MTDDELLANVLRKLLKEEPILLEGNFMIIDSGAEMTPEEYEAVERMLAVR